MHEHLHLHWCRNSSENICVDISLYFIRLKISDDGRHEVFFDKNSLNKEIIKPQTN